MSFVHGVAGSKRAKAWCLNGDMKAPVKSGVGRMYWASFTPWASQLLLSAFWRYTKYLYFTLLKAFDFYHTCTFLTLTWTLSHILLENFWRMLLLFALELLQYIWTVKMSNLRALLHLPCLVQACGLLVLIQTRIRGVNIPKTMYQAALVRHKEMVLVQIKLNYCSFSVKHFFQTFRQLQEVLADYCHRWTSDATKQTVL